MARNFSLELFRGDLNPSDGDFAFLAVALAFLDDPAYGAPLASSHVVLGQAPLSQLDFERGFAFLGQDTTSLRRAFFETQQ